MIRSVRTPNIPVASQCQILLALCWAACALFPVRAQDRLSPSQIEFFEVKIRPVLVEHCYACHSARAKEIKGGLRLDLRAGWQVGGDSGTPAIIVGDAAASPLIQSMRHAEGVAAMPPERPKLSAQIISDFEHWVNSRAPDPRDGELASLKNPADWQTLFQQRLRWWSLQPRAKISVPVISTTLPARNSIDSFVLHELDEHRLRPSIQADSLTLVRRLNFALLGLPPSAGLADEFAGDSRPDAYERLVDRLLGDPRFGERWARHWLDVVHYSDTHGYEWDAPAKNAWMYRDYVVRAFNADLPIRRFFLEQLAGDLVETRIENVYNLVENHVAPMALRLGERRHGDNADAEGISQEAMANTIDTLGKGFLGTTIACAQCHDHKLDAISQRDYYSLVGMFMSSRWSARCVDAADRNRQVIDSLKQIKSQLRREMVSLWKESRERIATQIRLIAKPEKRATKFPESIAELWLSQVGKPISPDEFQSESRRRAEHNRTHLKLLADFTGRDPQTGANGWRWDGSGMQHGLAASGDFVVSDEGDTVIAQILPAGRWSHLWSSRLAGALRSPMFDRHSAETFSVHCAGALHSGYTFVVEQALHSERLKFLNQLKPNWLTLPVGEFRTLEGSLDAVDRRMYFEFVTKSLNNYFPPRTGFGGVTESVAADPRSWFGVTKIYVHPKGKPPLDELARFLPIFSAQGDLAERLADAILQAVDDWSSGSMDEQSAQLLDDALRSKLLPNDLKATQQASRMVAEYHQLQTLLVPDQVVGSLDDWNEGKDDRIGVRGSYTDFGDQVPRAKLSMWAASDRAGNFPDSGRLRFARAVTNDSNPLTARVFVNRVWQHLFGEGLVRTPDDFGHLGESPSHPELLDDLAQQFVDRGWSLKWLVKTIVTSATWRQSSVASQQSMRVDPENRFLHHFPVRRLEAEAIRDTLLVVSGNLDASIGGAPIEPYRTAEDAAKRLFSGPLASHGRRSLYIKMTLMEPPRFLALFNQPIPKLTTGRRDVTNVPDQALALLNDPFVNAMAESWSQRLVNDDQEPVSERLGRMFQTAISRPATSAELDRMAELLQATAKLRGIDPTTLQRCQVVWQDVAHALFNLQEFIHVH